MTESSGASKTSIYNDLKKLGLTRAFVHKILPDWWDDTLLSTQSGLIQFSIILKQRLDVEYKYTTKPVRNISFCLPRGTVQYKKRKTVDEQRIQQSSLLCQSLLRTVLRAQERNRFVQHIDELRYKIEQNEVKLNLENILGMCWDHNVPVIFADKIPARLPKPAGLVMKYNGRYGIVLAHRHKNDAAQLFVLLHEIGHIMSGHLENQSTIFDESHGATDGNLKVDADIQEIEADDFALNTLRKGIDLRFIINEQKDLRHPAELTMLGHQVEMEHGIPAGHTILTYGREKNEWALAQQALGFFPSKDAVEVILNIGSASLTELEFSGDDFRFLEMSTRI